MTDPKADQILTELQTLAKSLEAMENHDFGYVEASGISRLLHHIGTPSPGGEFAVNKPFAILTAFRKRDVEDRPLSLSQNRQRNSELLSMLGALKLGAYKLVGSWLGAPEEIPYEEAKKENKLTRVSEESFFVPWKEDYSLEEFETIVLGLVRKFQQDAAVFSDGKQVSYLMKNGSKDKVGNTMFLNPQNLGDAYSKMKNRKDKFVFAGVLQPINVTSRHLFKKKSMFWFSENEENELKAYAALLLEGAMKFKDYKSHGGTSKMWINPKGQIILVPDQHLDWLRENEVLINKIYKLDMPKWKSMDDQKARLWALNNGFVRVNYMYGDVTFELVKKTWNNQKIQDVIRMIIKDNADDLDMIKINILNEDGTIYKSKTTDVKEMESVSAKVRSIPLMDKSRNKLFANLN